MQTPRRLVRGGASGSGELQPFYDRSSPRRMRFFMSLAIMSRFSPGRRAEPVSMVVERVRVTTESSVRSGTMRQPKTASKLDTAHEVGKWETDRR